MRKLLSEVIKEFKDNLNERQTEELGKYDAACLEDCYDLVYKLEVYQDTLNPETEPSECDILSEAFGFLDGYYFIANDNKKEYFEYDIVILDGLIKFFEYYKKQEVIDMLKSRQTEIESWIKGDAWNE